jgi:hypothetical protein
VVGCVISEESERVNGGGDKNLALTGLDMPTISLHVMETQLVGNQGTFVDFQ